MSALEYSIPLLLLVFAFFIGIRMMFGRHAYEYVKSRFFHNLIRSTIRLPLRLISFIFKFPRS